MTLPKSARKDARSFLHEKQKALVARGDGVVILYDYVSSSSGPGIEIYSTKAQVLANEVVGSARSQHPGSRRS